MFAPTLAMYIVNGIKIINAGIFMNPILKGKLVLINNPVKKNPMHPDIEIKNPIEAAVPIDILIVYDSIH